MGEEIGKGTFGVVRVATHIITGEKVAVKILYKNRIKEENDKKRLEKEIKILKILRHNNIVQLYNVFQTEYKERYILGYPKQINYKCTKKILEQMEKNICCIYQGEKQGTGFFARYHFLMKIICYLY